MIGQAGQSYNHFKCLHGIEKDGGLSAYVAESRLKRHIEYVERDILMKLSALKYPNTKKIISIDDVITKLQKLKPEQVQKAFSIYEETGLYDSILYIISSKRTKSAA